MVTGSNLVTGRSRGWKAPPGGCCKSFNQIVIGVTYRLAAGVESEGEGAFTGQFVVGDISLLCDNIHQITLNFYRYWNP